MLLMLVDVCHGAQEPVGKLQMIDSSQALKSIDKEFIGKHIAALKWFDANVILWGQQENDLIPFLKKAIVQKNTKGGSGLDMFGNPTPDCTLYKFPLYEELCEYKLADEPRTNYDFYAVWVDEKERTIYNSAFVYHGSVQYRPSYNSFRFFSLEDAEKT